MTQELAEGRDLGSSFRVRWYWNFSSLQDRK